jgi:hypothetical protein
MQRSHVILSVSMSEQCCADCLLQVAKLTDELETERGYIQQHVRKLIFRASSPAGKLEDDMSEESGSGSSAHSRTRSGTS